MPRKRIRSKKKNSYRFMDLYDDLHCVLTWMPLSGMKDIDWEDKELIGNLWTWHGKKIMNLKYRLNKLRQKLAEKEIDALFVSQPENRYYLSGLDGSDGFLLITPQNAI